MTSTPYHPGAERWYRLNKYTCTGALTSARLEELSMLLSIGAMSVHEMRDRIMKESHGG